VLISSHVALYFNIRTRSLNSLMFNIFQVIGAVFVASMLDNKMISSRRTRGFITVATVAIIVIAGWIGLTVWLYRNPILDPLSPPLFDWTDGPFGGFFVLNLIFGMNMVIVWLLPFNSPSLQTSITPLLLYSSLRPIRQLSHPQFITTSEDKH